VNSLEKYGHGIDAGTMIGYLISEGGTAMKTTIAKIVYKKVALCPYNPQI